MPAIAFEMKFHAEVKKEGRWYIARTPALDVYSQGATERKALDNLVEALQAFIESCFERGVLDQVLKEAGFHVKRGISRPLKRNNHIVNVPISLIARNAAENRAR